MIRSTVVVMVAMFCLAFAAGSPVAGAFSPGPFVGILTQDETESHRFDNYPPGTYCIDIVVPYLVTLDYAPATDTVNLTLVAGETVAHLTGEAGHAEEVVSLSYCTVLDLVVGGEDVDDEAVYTVTLTRLA